MSQKENKMKIDSAMVSLAVNVCEQNKKLFSALGIADFDRAYCAAKKMLYATSLQEDYGINSITLGMVSSCDDNIFVRINENVYIAMMGSKYNRTISCSADGKQPEDEVMFVISFSTGPYVLGEDYPKELFSKMFDEIKAYGFKYVDDVNHNVYFTLGSAAPIANSFCGILAKYRRIYCEESDVRRAEKMKLELENLEARINARKSLEKQANNEPNS